MMSFVQNVSRFATFLKLPKAKLNFTFATFLKLPKLDLRGVGQEGRGCSGGGGGWLLVKTIMQMPGSS